MMRRKGSTFKFQPDHNTTPSQQQQQQRVNMSWPRIQFHEIGDQPWCPSWLHHHEQFSLSQLWNLRVPFWSHGSLATQACAVIKEHLRNPSDYTVVDVCAGAGGPTPLIERELNRRSEKDGTDIDAQPVRFVLTDMFPPVDVWAGIAKKQPNIEFVERAVDARSVGRLSSTEKESGKGQGKECRMFNICFHHFDDADAAGILGSAVREADAFLYVYPFPKVLRRDCAKQTGYSKSPPDRPQRVYSRRWCFSGDFT